MGIFKACDIRGVYGHGLTDDVAYRIGRALGTVFAGRSILVGGDVRLSTPALRARLVDGLLASGAAVTDIGTVPTPAFYFGKRHLGLDAGVMITASHNPSEFNGFKIIPGELPITEDQLEAIRRTVEAGDFRSGDGTLSEADVLPAYRQFIERAVPTLPGAESFPVVVDCGSGCYSGIAPSVFSRLGYPVATLFDEPDGSFPGRSPNSADPRALGALSRLVMESGARLGVAFDGDGDRVSFIDERGRFLTIDRAIVILSRHVLETGGGGTVVHDLKCSSVVPQSIRMHGGTAVPERSGHTFIKARMIAEDAVFGGELSGHFFYRELRGGDDGLYSALLMVDIVRRSGGSLAALADSVPEFATTPDLRIPIEGDRRSIIERIAEQFPGDRVSRLDGVRVDFGDGWALARASVTEPVITIRFEAQTGERLARIVDEFLRSVPDIRSAVDERLHARDTRA